MGLLEFDSMPSISVSALRLADKVSGGGYSISLGDYSEEWKSQRRLAHSALQHCVAESLHCLIEEQALYLKQVQNEDKFVWL